MRGGHRRQRGARLADASLTVTQFLKLSFVSVYDQWENREHGLSILRPSRKGSLQYLVVLVLVFDASFPPAFLVTCLLPRVKLNPVCCSAYFHSRRNLQFFSTANIFTLRKVGRQLIAL